MNYSGFEGPPVLVSSVLFYTKNKINIESATFFVAPLAGVGTDSRVDDRRTIIAIKYHKYLY